MWASDRRFFFFFFFLCCSSGAQAEASVLDNSIEKKSLES
jgi:hypothetical protein